MKQYFVYILASKRNGTLYIGVTNNLLRRVWEHKNGKVEGFTKKYKVHMLVYYEQSGYIVGALDREKKLKKWERKWKMDLIEKMNLTKAKLSSKQLWITFDYSRVCGGGALSDRIYS